MESSKVSFSDILTGNGPDPRATDHKNNPSHCRFTPVYQWTTNNPGKFRTPGSVTFISNPNLIQWKKLCVFARQCRTIRSHHCWFHHRLTSLVCCKRKFLRLVELNELKWEAKKWDLARLVFFNNRAYIRPLVRLWQKSHSWNNPIRKLIAVYETWMEHVV